ncbi:MAG: glycoside hydrolase family 97 protein [Candidatus Aminicenantes bacterium]|nr:glycoside hydrolase family 97 protein [Candidatus Aminicenantes bacterium]
MRNNNKKNFLIFVIAGVFLCLVLGGTVFGKEYRVLSPGKKIELAIKTGSDISYRVFYKGKELLQPSAIAMTVHNKGTLGKKPKVLSVKKNTVNRKVYPVVRQKSKEIIENYNELVMKFAGDYSLIFRAYNEGAAYRFETRFKEGIQVDSETVEFNFKEDNTVYFPEEKGFFSHNERTYIVQSLSRIGAEKMCSLPALVAAKEGTKILITESDLTDYPGLWLNGGGNRSLYGKLPGYPLKVEQPRDRDVKVVEYAGYLAKTKGSRSFPWRIMVIAGSDGELITNQVTFLLAEPCRVADTSWIKPGKVAWDWFNFNNIYGVDFRAGINTATYKYYIDFASKYGIEYVILDEGWYKLGDLFDINPDIDLPGLLAHAKKKNVGIILWVVWKTLDDQFYEALDQFEKWGVKGLKVDFMQRDDQWMVNYYHKVARECAKRRMIVDFHGSYKPAGLRRTYPNVLTREGVQGLEHVKWSARETPEHNVTLPFIRMVAGPMDYTPGAMLNAQKDSFKSIFKRPMSMGTRCHQLAMYVVYESPLQMLADSPSNYLREPECLEFLSKVPSVWDETLVPAAKVGDYVVVVRRSGVEWYVGAMTDWSEREIDLDFSFLGSGDYTMEMYRDGINADRCASDYKKEVRAISSSDKIRIKLAEGGGWAARIYPR